MRPLENGRMLRRRTTIGPPPIHSVIDRTRLEEDTRIAWVFLVLTTVGLATPQLRYAGYLCAGLAIFLIIYRAKFFAPQFLHAFLLITVVGALSMPAGNVRGAKDLFFIFSGISIGMIARSIRVSPSAILIILLVVLAVLAAQGHTDVGTIQIDVGASHSTFESSLSFLFGLIAAWAATQRRWAIVLVSTALTVLTLKRIAVVGIIVAIGVAVLPARAKRLILHPVVMVLMNLLIVALIVLYASGKLDRAISESTGMSANALGQGRQVLLETAAQTIATHPSDFILFGRGPGSAYETIERLQLERPIDNPNLHCDLLKILYEYGLAVFVVFVYLLYRSKSLNWRILAVFANVTFISDNTLTYHFFLFFLCMLGLHVSKAEGRQIPSGPFGPSGM